MAVTVSHAKTSAKADGADATLVQPSDWNAGHTVTGVTTVATDTIWDAAGDLAVGSGADTAVRLAKGNAGAVLAMGNGSVIWNAGTSFPASKATGDRYWRTDLAMDFYYDGTRWLTVQEFIHPIPNGDSAFPAWPLTANGNPGRSTLLSSDWQIYLVKYYANTYVSTTNSGTAYWTVNLIADPGGSTIATFNTSADSPDTHTGHAVSVNTALTTSFRTVTVQAIKTSTPGNLYAPSAMLYRLVGV